MEQSELLDLLQSLAEIDTAIQNGLETTEPKSFQTIALKRAQNAIDLAKAQIVSAMLDITVGGAK